MGLLGFGEQTGRLALGGAVDLHESHGAGQAIWRDAAGALEGAHTLAQGRVQNHGSALAGNRRQAVEQRQMAGQPVHGRAGAAFAQTLVVTRRQLPVSGIVAAPHLSQLDQPDTVQGPSESQGRGLIIQPHQQCVHRRALGGLQCQDARAIELAQQGHGQFAGAVALQLLRAGGLTGVGAVGGQLPVRSQLAPGAVDIGWQLRPKRCQVFQWGGWQAG